MLAVPLIVEIRLTSPFIKTLFATKAKLRAGSLLIMADEKVSGTETCYSRLATFFPLAQVYL